MSRERASLGAFLRARRDALSPAQAGVEVFGTSRRVVTKIIDHPVAGRVSFNIEILEEARQPDQRLVIYTTEQRSFTARTLPLLASWGAPGVPSLT